MEVLVTGSTGFVGSYLVPALIEAGHDVRCLHRSTSDLTPLSGLKAELLKGDVTRPETLLNAVKGVDSVIHLVGILREGEDSFQDVNVGGVRNLLEACRKEGVQVAHVWDLGTRPESRSEFSRTKAMGARLVRESGLPHTILRPGLILGRRGDFTERLRRLVIRYRRIPVVGSGENMIQPIFVGDVVEALVAAVGRKPEGETWDLVGPERVSWADFVIQVSHTLGLERRIRRVPPWLAGLASRASSILPGETLATRDEIIMAQEDVTGDPADFERLTGREPLGLEECLSRSFAEG